MLSQFVGEWPSPVTCEGRMRCWAASDCPKRNRRAGLIVRGFKQLERRFLVADTPDLAWLLRACRGADNSRAPHRAVVVQDDGPSFVSPACEASRDYVPGKKASKRPPGERNAARPQAEPSGLMSDKVVLFNADLAPPRQSR